MMEREFLITWSIRDRDTALQEIGSIISNLAECKDDNHFSKKERIFLENKMNEINNVFFGKKREDGFLKAYNYQIDCIKDKLVTLKDIEALNKGEIEWLDEEVRDIKDLIEKLVRIQEIQDDE